MKKTKSKTKNRFIKQPLLMGLAAIVLIGAALAVLEIIHVTDFYHKKPAVKPASGQSQPNGNDPNSKIDLSPGTPADNAATDKMKAGAGSSTPTPSTGTAGAQIVTTNANYDSTTNIAHIGTLVSGTTAGICTAHFALNGDSSKTLSVGSQVVLQGNSYTCGALSANKSQFPQSGTYTVYVTLSSGGSESKSSNDPPTVTIP